MARLRKFHRLDRVKLMETSPKSLGGGGGGGGGSGGGNDGLSAPSLPIISYRQAAATHYTPLLFVPINNNFRYSQSVCLLIKTNEINVNDRFN